MIMILNDDDIDVIEVGTWNDSHGLRIMSEVFPTITRRQKRRNATYIVTTVLVSEIALTVQVLVKCC